MKNVDKNIQESLMRPIFQKFNSGAKCTKDVKSNLFWLMHLANENGMMAGITFRLEHKPNTHSGVLVHIKVEDYQDNNMYENIIEFNEEKVIAEINSIIMLIKKELELEDYYIL